MIFISRQKRVVAFEIEKIFEVQLTEIRVQECNSRQNGKLGYQKMTRKYFRKEIQKIWLVFLGYDNESKIESTPCLLMTSLSVLNFVVTSYSDVSWLTDVEIHLSKNTYQR